MIAQAPLPLEGRDNSRDCLKKSRLTGTIGTYYT